MKIKILESKWLTIISAFVSTLLLSAVIIWVAQDSLSSYAILTNPNFVTRNEVKEKFILKENITDANIYKFEQEGDETKFINISDEYFNREILRNGTVFEKENFGNDTTFINKDNSYLKKEIIMLQDFIKLMEKVIT